MDASGALCNNEYVDICCSSGRRWYYLKPDGRMTANQWEQVSGNWYYFDTNGVMQTGWLKLGNIWYYLKPSGNMTANQWKQVIGQPQ